MTSRVDNPWKWYQYGCTRFKVYSRCAFSSSVPSWACSEFWTVSFDWMVYEVLIFLFIYWCFLRWSTAPIGVAEGRIWLWILRITVFDASVSCLTIFGLREPDFVLLRRGYLPQGDRRCSFDEYVMLASFPRNLERTSCGAHWMHHDTRLMLDVNYEPTIFGQH